MATRLFDLYTKEFRPALQKELGIKNIMRVPRLKKIVINIGAKDAVADSKAIAKIKTIVDTIAAQSSVKTVAKKSIAGFKLREGVAIGVKVTLRRDKMYEFMDRLINFALPRVRDFRGIKRSFDGNGNLNMGLNDWMVFPEVDYDTVDRVRGMNITFETSATDDNEAYALLKCFNMPFVKENKN